MVYSNIWLNLDTLPARLAGHDVFCSSGMRFNVASTVQSEGSLPVNKHCFSWVVRIRANGIAAGERLFPVRFVYRAFKRALAMLSGMSASPGIISPTLSQGFERRASYRFLKNEMMPHSLLVNRWRVRDHYLPTQKIDKSLLWSGISAL